MHGIIFEDDKKKKKEKKKVIIIDFTRLNNEKVLFSRDGNLL